MMTLLRLLRDAIQRHYLDGVYSAGWRDGWNMHEYVSTHRATLINGHGGQADG